MTLIDAPSDARAPEIAVSARARQLLEVASVWGPSFSLEDMADVIGEPPARLLPPMAELIGAGILVTSGESIGFVDDVVHGAVYDEIPETFRVALHHQIGALLLARGGDPAQAAEHLVLAARSNDRLTLLDLDRATNDLIASAPESAVQFAVRALAMTEPTDELRFARTVTAVDALIRAGRPAAASHLARSTLAATGAPRTRQAELRLVLSSISYAGGRIEEAIAEAESVRCRSGLAEKLYAEADLAHLLGLLTTGDVDRTREAAGAIMAGRNDDAALAAAFTACAFIAWDEGRVADALGFVRAAIQRGESDAIATHRAHPRLALAGMLTALGNMDEADLAIDEAAEDVAVTRDTLWTPVPSVLRARLRLLTGQLDDAEAEATKSLDASEVLGTYLHVPLALATLADVALCRGDLLAATRHLAYGRDFAMPCAGFGSGNIAWTSARLREASDGSAGAIEQLHAVYDEIATHKRLLLEPGASTWMVRTALAAHDRGRAEQVVIAAEQLSVDNQAFTEPAAAARHARGLFDEDADAVREAGECHTHPWLRATAADDAGVLLARASDAYAAREQLEVAIAGYVLMGADRDAARIRSLLRELGVRRRHWHQVDRPVEGWDSLTDTERRVAEIVAEGLTNRQTAERLFLSRHTVDFHLRHVFRKLGIGSRAELTRLALEELDIAG
ncbi:MAG TPA: LuxR C-terminal-related transcriptional regulator [Acidimicrobiia bacterium]